MLPQIQAAALPLTGGSALTNVPGSATLRGTAGMTFDASGRLWVISYPQAGGIVALVYTVPVTPASTPALVFNLPPSGDIDFLSFDSAGNLWASDYFNIVQYMFAGPFTTSRTLVPPVTLALPGFTHPTGNAVDAVGNLFVADCGGPTAVGIRSYPTATNLFSAILAPSTTYTNVNTNLGCVWGITIH